MPSIYAFLLGMILAACNGNLIRDKNVDHGKPQEAHSGDGIILPKPSENPQGETPPVTIVNPGSIPWSPLPDTAVPPVAVSGASLFCYKQGDVHCLASDMAGKPYPFRAKKAFYSTAKAKSWVATTFHPTNDSPDLPGDEVAADTDWIVNVPADLQDQDVAVLLLSESSNFMADWLGGAMEPSLNLIADGSFENLKIDFNNIEMTRNLMPSAQKYWKAYLPVPTNPCIAIHELSRTDAAFVTTAVASEGAQWTELSANCELGRGSLRNLIGLTQDVSLQVDHHYQISFDYMSPLGVEYPTQFKLSIGDQTIAKMNVATGSWKKFKSVFRANKILNKVDFVEMGLVANRGTAIDNVKLVDLGDFGSATYGQAEIVIIAIPIPYQK